jgi:hypothetical protein
MDPTWKKDGRSMSNEDSKSTGGLSPSSQNEQQAYWLSELRKAESAYRTGAALYNARWVSLRYLKGLGKKLTEARNKMKDI